MVTKKPGAIAAAVVGILFIGWLVYSLQESEADRIRQRLYALADVVSTMKHQPDTARLLHVAGLKQFFTPDVTIRLSGDLPAVTGRDNLLKMAHVAFQQEPNLTVAFTDVTVVHDDGTQDARVNTTVVVTGVHSPKAKSVDARELEIDLVKAEDDWLIAAIRSVKAMELQ